MPRITPACCNRPSGKNSLAPTAPTSGQRASAIISDSQSAVRRRVVVEQTDIFAARGFPHGAVVHRREVEVAGVTQHADAAADLGKLVFDVLQIIAGLGLAAAVIDDDQLVIFVTRDL